VPEAPCEELPWDSSFWGIRVAKVLGSTLDGGAADAVDAWCESNEIACLYLLADPGDAGTGRVAAERGYRFVDLRVTLVNTAGSPRPPGSSGAAIREARDGDDEALREIARGAHTDTRFFFDGGFPRERCADLYATWMERERSDPATLVLVRTEEERAVGYVTIARGPEPAIGLLAVDDEHSGRGIATDLVAAALSSVDADQPVRVVTQGRNVGALRVYERCGFVAESTGVWYHKWFR
jgi:ribosomal protein S18 acetylase RimI-like enzyme